MPSEALIIFIAALSFCVVSSKPAASRGNDGNGNFGFKYEVSHYPGNSRSYMNTGGASNNHQAPRNSYHDTNKHEEGGYNPRSPPSEYRPNRYENAEKPHTGHSPNGPEIIHDPQPEYPSPYDSASKNHYNDVYQGGDKTYIDNDVYSPSIHSSSIPEERYAHHPSKDQHAPESYPGHYANAPVSQEHLHPHVSQEHLNPHVSQEHLNPHVSQEYINPPVSQEHVNPHISQEHIDPPVSQEYVTSPVAQEHVNPHISQEQVNPHISQEHINPPVSQEHVNPHISQEYINPPVSQKYINPPVSQEYINPPVSQEYINPPVSQEYVTSPVAQEYVSPHIPQEPIYQQVHQEQVNPHISQEQVNPHISQEQLNPHISQEFANLPVSKKNVAPHIQQEPAPIHVEYPNSPVQQDHIDVPISQDSIYPHISQEYTGNPGAPQETIVPSIKQKYPHSVKTVVEPQPLEQVSVPVYDEPNKESEPVPVGPKYQFIPSGPPYVTNSHTTQIIHPPLPSDSHNAGPVEEYTYNSPSLDDEVKPASVSHAFRLPIPALSPAASNGPHVDQIAPEDHSGDNHHVSPISHSTRLLIPSSGPSSQDTDVADLLPKSQLDVKSPGSFQNIADELSPFAPFPQSADLKSLQIEAEVAGNAPGSVEVSQHGPANGGSAQPPISHAFRLNLPGGFPSLQLPPAAPQGNPVEEKVSSALDEASLTSSVDVPHTPRISHAFRLSLPQNHK